ncbi:MAG: DUF4150 domain-containing protein [Syntrophus sp. (in: bacteria)]
MFATTIAGGQEASSIPDVCKTVVGPAVVPMPYPVTAMPSTAMPVTKKVFIVNAPALNRLSKVVPTMGDQAGASGGGGVVSGSIMGPVEYLMSSAKVFLEGAPAVRQTDTVTVNNRNTIGANSLPSQTKVLIMG